MNVKYVAAGVIAFSAGASFFVGYCFAVKKLTRVYDEGLTTELEKTHKHYEWRLEMETSKLKSHYNELLKEMPSSPTELMPEATVTALRDYNGISAKKNREEQNVVEEIPSLIRLPETREPAVMEVDPEVEEWLAKADKVPISPILPKKLVPLKSDIVGEQRKDSPQVISWQDFQDNEPEYEQQTLTYFAGDNTLIDQRDKQIESIELTIGIENLGRFGELSNDKHVVLIRNENYRTDYEVCLSLGCFSEEVEGESSS
jgi:hypothetical protein